MPLKVDESNSRVVTNVVKTLCMHAQTCRFTVTNNLFGNPHWLPIWARSVRVVYRCGKTREEKEFEVKSVQNKNLNDELDNL